MNKHFDDARYYAKRAVQNAMRGVRTELEPVEEWVRAKTGRETEPDLGRTETVRREMREFAGKIEGEVGETVGSARGRLRTYRGR